jgi:hypothetical protein
MALRRSTKVTKLHQVVQIKTQWIDLISKGTRSYRMMETLHCCMGVRLLDKYIALSISPSSVVYHAMQGSPSGAKIAQSNDMKGTRTIDT